MTQEALTTFAREKGLLGTDLAEKDIGMIFAAVKLGKKDTLSFERFQEALNPSSLAHWLATLARGSI